MSLSRNRPPIDSKFEAHAVKQRFTIRRSGKVLAGTDSRERAESLLAVLSREGKLPGFELVTRGRPMPTRPVTLLHPEGFDRAVW